jgi:membrane associated rhomboid family serine protease
MINLTVLIITVTCVISFLGFSNEATVVDKLIFYPPAITQKNEWYRFITCGFVHADIQHLAFNMFTLYFFGIAWETEYIGHLGVVKYWYIILYLGALIASLIPTYIKNRNNYRYRSLGASGAVSAIVFSMILLMPWSKLYVFVIPIPAIIYACLFLGYSVYMSKKGGDYINHDAHLWGAFFGIIFSIALRPEVIGIFLNEISHPYFSISSE